MKINIIIALFAIVLALTGCSNNVPKILPIDQAGKQVVDVKAVAGEVKKALWTEGLELMPIGTPENDWVLNGVVPRRFTVGSPVEQVDPAKLEQVSIYVFESEDACKKGLAYFSNQTENYNMVVPRVYEAKNVMVLYWAHAAIDEPAKYEQQFQKAIDRLNAQ